MDSSFDAGDQRAPIKGAFVCDSGGLQWSGDSDNPKTPQDFRKMLQTPAHNLKQKWPNATLWGASNLGVNDYLQFVLDFKRNNASRMVPDAHGKLIFGYEYPMIIFDLSLIHI